MIFQYPYFLYIQADNGNSGNHLLCHPVTGKTVSLIQRGQYCTLNGNNFIENNSFALQKYYSRHSSSLNCESPLVRQRFDSGNPLKQDIYTSSFRLPLYCLRSLTPVIVFINIRLSMLPGITERLLPLTVQQARLRVTLKNAVTM